MKVSVAGSGYASYVIAACLAEMGNQVCHINLTGKVPLDQLPFHEPGLTAMLSSNEAARRLNFSSDMASSIDGADVLFIALEHSESVDSKAIDLAGLATEYANSDVILVNSSPTSLGVTERMQSVASASSHSHAVVCHPAFLKEGEAIDDFMRPDRIILGAEDYEARNALVAMLKPFSRQQDRIAVMSVRDAELTRLAASAMLASRISLMNEIAAIAEQYGADIENVRRGIGADGRIGYSYLYPGVGYGGVCLPGDLQELAATAERQNISPVLLKAVTERNELQQTWAFNRLRNKFGSLEGKRVAIWGLSFRPDTADVSNSAAIVLIRQLLDAGASVSAYDPMAMKNARVALESLGSSFSDEQVRFCDHQYDALTDADALVLMTEWKPFRQPDFNAIGKLLREQVIIDGRNQYDAESLRQAGFVYCGVGRGTVA